MMDEAQVQVLELPEMKLIGLSITSSFVGHEPERVEAMKREFNSRKDEISNIIHPERYLSPHFTSENLFTYMICMEVEELTNVPEGMLGFTIPAHRYVQVKSKGDPYEVLHTYVRENGLQSNDRALAIEIYQFSNPTWPDEVDVYIPLR
ncbi:effector binding domain-containing protein [Paenibacillus sp. G2S3]|uniref:GyrI-like domain-containing protein n=1 Tax=Paenibacillus sp. G2S3 TaxID=3047872 RepID=UPI0024C13874|nr:effector binding domain-containing protein [Paenibacillus sp. G2S3]WHY21543.1 effector binding domain-containing protein [Paenibacillus sp. G2S3]